MPQDPLARQSQLVPSGPVSCFGVPAECGKMGHLLEWTTFHSARPGARAAQVSQPRETSSAPTEPPTPPAPRRIQHRVTPHEYYMHHGGSGRRLRSSHAPTRQSAWGAPRLFVGCFAGSRHATRSRRHARLIDSKFILENQQGRDHASRTIAGSCALYEAGKGKGSDASITGRKTSDGGTQL